VSEKEDGGRDLKRVSHLGGCCEEGLEGIGILEGLTLLDGGILIQGSGEQGGSVALGSGLA